MDSPDARTLDPFALPCHPSIRLTAEDRDWRAIGVKSLDRVVRKSTRCPECKTDWTAFLRTFLLPKGEEVSTVEWLRPTPFRVTAVSLPEQVGVVWQDEATDAQAYGSPPVDDGPPLDLGPAWERSVQRVAPVHVLTAGGRVFAEPGDELLERREKWNAQDRRLALLWSPRLQAQVVAWHGFGRLLQA